MNNDRGRVGVLGDHPNLRGYPVYYRVLTNAHTRIYYSLA
jgi:hypothetical protein